MAQSLRTPADQIPTDGQRTYVSVNADSGSAVGEPLERLVYVLVHRIAAFVARIRSDNQMRVRPGAGEFPCRGNRTTQIESTMDQHARNAGESQCTGEECALFEPCAIRKVVCSDSHECKQIRQRAVTVRIQFAVRLQ